jgi:hypothetical protein
MTALFEVMPGHSFSRAHWSMSATPDRDEIELRIDVTMAAASLQSGSSKRFG